MNNNMKAKAVAFLNEKFEAANWEPIFVTMKSNGSKVFITPCLFDEERGIEWFLMDNHEVPNLCGGETLEDVADILLDYDNILAQNIREIKWLKSYVLSNEADWYEQDRSYFSDLFKDVYGRRPHISLEQLLEWARSYDLECPVPANKGICD